MKKLPYIVDNETEINIVLEKGIESIQMNAIMKDKQYKKHFIFPEKNSEDFEIVIRKIK